MEHLAGIVHQQQALFPLRCPELLPACDRLLDDVGVGADPGCAPDIGDGVAVVRVVLVVEQGRVEVLEVGQLGAIQRLQHSLFGHFRDEVGAGHHHVIAVAMGFQLGVEGLVGFVGGVDHLDAGLLLELLQQAVRHIFRPVVEVDHLVVGRVSALAQQRGGEGEGGCQQGAGLVLDCHQQLLGVMGPCGPP